MSLSSFEVIVLVGLAGLLAGAIVTWLGMRICQLQERIQALEASTPPARPAGPKRLPYEAADELIDAMAVLDAMREKRMLEVEHYDNVRSHLAKALETGTKRATVPVRDEKEL